MACCEAVESMIFLRGLFLSFVYGKIIPEEQCGSHIAMHAITDCKSLYDHVHREGIPKAPSEKRLVLDLSGLRQILCREAKHQWIEKHGAEAEHTPERPCRPPLHWVPTQTQMADLLTKLLKADAWWEEVRTGILQLPLRSSQVNNLKERLT